MISFRPGRRSRARRAQFANLPNNDGRRQIRSGHDTSAAPTRRRLGGGSWAPLSRLSIARRGRPGAMVRSPETAETYQHQPPATPSIWARTWCCPNRCATNDFWRRPTAPTSSSPQVPPLPAGPFEELAGAAAGRRWCPWSWAPRQGTNQRMSEIVEEVLPGHPAGILAGPTSPRRWPRGTPPRRCWPCPTRARPRIGCSAPALSHLHHRRRVGVEMAGALKNVYAIGSGWVTCWVIGEHPGHGDDPGGAGDVRWGGHGRAPRHVRRPGRDGRSGGHLHQPAQPQTGTSASNWGREVHRRDHRPDESGRRGRESVQRGDGVADKHGLNMPIAPGGGRRHQPRFHRRAGLLRPAADKLGQRGNAPGSTHRLSSYTGWCPFGRSSTG